MAFGREARRRGLSLIPPAPVNGSRILAWPEPTGRGFNRRPFLCPFPDLSPVVGFARTAEITSSAPTGAKDQRAVRLAYYTYVEAGPKPSVVVIADRDKAAPNVLVLHADDAVATKRRSWDGIPCVVIGSADVSDSRLSGESRYLQKPFCYRELIRAIEQLLNDGDAA